MHELDVILVCCLAHCRRKFYEAVPSVRRKKLKLPDIQSMGDVRFPTMQRSAMQRTMRLAESIPVPHLGSRCRSQCCYVQHNRNYESKQPERVPVPLPGAAMYAELQKWTRRHRHAAALEWLYQGTLFGINRCWKYHTRKTRSFAALNRSAQNSPLEKCEIRLVIHRLRFNG